MYDDSPLLQFRNYQDPVLTSRWVLSVESFDINLQSTSCLTLAAWHPTTSKLPQVGGVIESRKTHYQSTAPSWTRQQERRTVSYITSSSGGSLRSHPYSRATPGSDHQTLSQTIHR